LIGAARAMPTLAARIIIHLSCSRNADGRSSDGR
jgi:hypothetical protein